MESIANFWHIWPHKNNRKDHDRIWLLNLSSIIVFYFSPVFVVNNFVPSFTFEPLACVKNQSKILNPAMYMIILARHLNIKFTDHLSDLAQLTAGRVGQSMDIWDFSAKTGVYDVINLKNWKSFSCGQTQSCLVWCRT